MVTRPKHSCKWLPSTHSCPPSWPLDNLHFMLHNGHLNWHPIITGERTSLIYLSTFYLSCLNLLSGLLTWFLTHPLISDKWTSVNSPSQILLKFFSFYGWSKVSISIFKDSPSILKSFICFFNPLSTIPSIFSNAIFFWLSISCCSFRHSGCW